MSECQQSKNIKCACAKSIHVSYPWVHQRATRTPLSPASSDFLPWHWKQQSGPKMAAYLEWRCYITLTTRSSPQSIISLHQQSWGQRSPHIMLLVELIHCSGNRTLVLRDSDRNQTLKAFSVSPDWLDDSWHLTQQNHFIVSKSCLNGMKYALHQT